jgi:hypothetical protein
MIRPRLFVGVIRSMVRSFLCAVIDDLENRSLPNDTVFLRNHGHDRNSDGFTQAGFGL